LSGDDGRGRVDWLRRRVDDGGFSVACAQGRFLNRRSRSRSTARRRRLGDRRLGPRSRGSYEALSGDRRVWIGHMGAP